MGRVKMVGTASLKEAQNEVSAIGKWLMPMREDVAGGDLVLVRGHGSATWVVSARVGCDIPSMCFCFLEVASETRFRWYWAPLAHACNPSYSGG
jgi:hypothetical protein